jgi:hypothetical protein
MTQTARRSAVGALLCPSYGLGHKGRRSLTTRIRPISATVHAGYHREADFARGTIRHEGRVLYDHTERLNARYIAGEPDSEALTAAILTSDDAQHLESIKAQTKAYGLPEPAPTSARR